MVISFLPFVRFASGLACSLTYSSIILDTNFAATRVKGSQPGAIDDQNQHFSTHKRGLLQPTNIINQTELINTLRLRYTSHPNFFGTAGQVLWVETSDYLFSCDYLFCQHDSTRVPALFGMTTPGCRQLSG